MKFICEKCKKEYKEKLKRCPSCGKKLKVVLTEQEQNDDFTVINTMMM